VRSSISAGVVFIAGLFAPLGAGKFDRKPQDYLDRLKCTFQLEDLRPRLLRSFFNKHDAPMAAQADEFVRIADEHNLDYRLLPAIALIETGGGKVCSNYNAFGWGNGRLRFKSWHHAIKTVGTTLATWHPYQNKTLDEALKVYNYEIPKYGVEIKKAMRMIDGRPVKNELVHTRLTLVATR